MATSSHIPWNQAQASRRGAEEECTYFRPVRKVSWHRVDARSKLQSCVLSLGESINIGLIFQQNLDNLLLLVVARVVQWTPTVCVKAAADVVICGI